MLPPRRAAAIPQLPTLLHHSLGHDQLRPRRNEFRRIGRVEQRNRPGRAFEVKSAVFKKRRLNLLGFFARISPRQLKNTGSRKSTGYAREKPQNGTFSSL